MLYMQKKFHADDDNKRYHKLRGHCHYTGKYRGIEELLIILVI